MRKPKSPNYKSNVAILQIHTPVTLALPNKTRNPPKTPVQRPIGRLSPTSIDYSVGISYSRASRLALGNNVCEPAVNCPRIEHAVARLNHQLVVLLYCCNQGEEGKKKEWSLVGRSTNRHRAPSVNLLLRSAEPWLLYTERDTLPEESVCVVWEAPEVSWGGRTALCFRCDLGPERLCPCGCVYWGWVIGLSIWRLEFWELVELNPIIGRSRDKNSVLLADASLKV